MTIVIELLVALLLIGGGVFALAAGVGILRMPDLYVRMHASTKAGTLAAGLAMAGVAVAFADAAVAMRAAIIVAFLLMTAPVAAHLIGRAAYKAKVPLWEKSVIDEYGDGLPSGKGANE